MNFAFKRHMSKFRVFIENSLDIEDTKKVFKQKLKKTKNQIFFIWTFFLYNLLLMSPGWKLWGGSHEILRGREARNWNEIDFWKERGKGNIWRAGLQRKYREPLISGFGHYWNWFFAMLTWMYIFRNLDVTSILSIRSPTGKFFPLFCIESMKKIAICYNNWRYWEILSIFRFFYKWCYTEVRCFFQR